jgi:hypothetical protein
VGATTISGNYTQLSVATLQIEIGDVFPGQWDVVTVEGNAIIDGAIEVVLINGFQPVLGNSFTVLSTNIGNVGGQFDIENIPVFNGLTFDVVYNPKSVVLQVVAASGLAGDYNEDGAVDAADYVVWRKNPDAFGGDPAGYNTWRTNFGTTAGGGAGTSTGRSTTVPEPASILLAFMAAIAVTAFCRLARVEQC